MTLEEYKQVMTRAAIMKRNPRTSESEVRQSLCEDALVKSEAPIPEMSVKVEKRKTTDEEKLNKLETAWLAVLREMGFPWIGIQNVTLRIAWDCRYTPDFITICEGGAITAFEVKGFMRDDAAVKLKVAARLFPFIRFVLVTKQDGNFKQESVKI